MHDAWFRSYPSSWRSNRKNTATAEENGHLQTQIYESCPSLLWIFHDSPYVFTGLLVWECLWIIAWVVIKLFFVEMQTKVVDSQNIEYLCPEI